MTLTEILENLYDKAYATAENQEVYINEKEAIEQAKKQIQELMLGEVKEEIEHWINLFVKYKADVTTPFNLKQQEKLAEYLKKKIDEAISNKMKEKLTKE